MSPNPDEAPRRGETRAVRSRGRLAEEVGMDEMLRGGPLPARPGSPRWFMQHYRRLRAWRRLRRLAGARMK